MADSPALGGAHYISARDISITPRNGGDGDNLTLFLDANTVAAYDVVNWYVPTDHACSVKCSIMSLAIYVPGYLL